MTIRAAFADEGQMLVMLRFSFVPITVMYWKSQQARLLDDWSNWARDRAVYMHGKAKTVMVSSQRRTESTPVWCS